MRVLAVDYGDARTGIAVSDPTGFLTGDTTVIASYRAEVVAEEIAKLCAKYGVERIAVGRPLNMNGTAGERALKAEAFAGRLREITGLPVDLSLIHI